VLKVVIVGSIPRKTSKLCLGSLGKERFRIVFFRESAASPTIFNLHSGQGDQTSLWKSRPEHSPTHFLVENYRKTLSADKRNAKMRAISTVFNKLPTLNNPKCVETVSKIRRKFVENSSKIRRKFVENSSKIRRKFVENSSKIRRKFVENSSKIRRKFAQSGHPAVGPLLRGESQNSGSSSPPSSLLPRSTSNRSQNVCAAQMDSFSDDEQGCQIFLRAKYQNGKKLPNYHELYQMSTKYNKKTV
jgi:hypothetical protein